MAAHANGIGKVYLIMKIMVILISKIDMEIVIVDDNSPDGT